MPLQTRTKKIRGPPPTASKSNAKNELDEPKITSKHRGVCWYRRTKKWVVQTKVNKKRVHVGYFSDEEEAAKAYLVAVANINQKGDVIKNIRYRLLMACFLRREKSTF